MPKKFKLPTNEEIQKKYEKAYGFNQQIGLYDQVAVNENFYIGNQWDGIDSGGLRENGECALEDPESIRPDSEKFQNKYDSYTDDKVNGAIRDSLDHTLTSENSPAQAKAVGDAVRGLFMEAIHGGDYVLESGESFACTQSGIRALRIGSGKAVMLGNLVPMAAGNVELPPAASGLNRNDLVVLRWERSGGVVSTSFAVVAGTETAGTPTDPELAQGDINAAGTVTREFPLYQAVFQGTTLQSVTALFYPETSQSFLQFRNVTVPLSAFQEYTGYADVGVALRAAVPLHGVTAEMYPDITFGVSDALGGALVGVAESYDGGVYVFASGMPEADVVIPLITVRKDV